MRESAPVSHLSFLVRRSSSFPSLLHFQWPSWSLVVAVSKRHRSAEIGISSIFMSVSLPLIDRFLQCTFTTDYSPETKWNGTRRAICLSPAPWPPYQSPFSLSLSLLQRPRILKACDFVGHCSRSKAKKF